MSAWRRLASACCCFSCFLLRVVTFPSRPLIRVRNEAPGHDAIERDRIGAPNSALGAPPSQFRATEEERAQGRVGRSDTVGHGCERAKGLNRGERPAKVSTVIMKEIFPSPPAVVRNDVAAVQALFQQNVVPSYGRF